MLKSIPNTYETSLHISGIYIEHTTIIYVCDKIYKFLENEEFEISIGAWFRHTMYVEKHSFVELEYDMDAWHVVNCEIKCSTNLKAKIKLVM